MNIAYYGHTRKLVYSYKLDGMYNEFTYSSGMKLIYETVALAFEAEDDFTGGFVLTTNNDDEFHRDYYELIQYKTKDNHKYYYNKKGSIFSCATLY